jgi:glycosyltransferase involved in cell wall biosynthesis
MFTIIICAYNSRIELLQEVIDSVNNQTHCAFIDEIIIVDNNSLIPLSSVFIRSEIRIKHIFEPQQGLVFARFSGIENCKSDWILFVDDDNLLDYRYVECAISIISANQKLGVFGAANIIPRYDKPPNSALAPYLSYLALRENNKAGVSNDPLDSYTPWREGLCVNLYVAKEWCKYMMKINLDFGRAGRNLLGGEDIIFSLVACNFNFYKGIFDDLKVMHYIPAWRLEKEYLLNLVYGTTLSGFRIRKLIDGDFKPRLNSLNIVLFDYFRELSNYRIHGKLKSMRLLKYFPKTLIKNSLNNEFINSKNQAVLEFLKNG